MYVFSLLRFYKYDHVNFTYASTKVRGEDSLNSDMRKLIGGMNVCLHKVNC